MVLLEGYGTPDLQLLRAGGGTVGDPPVANVMAPLRGRVAVALRGTVFGGSAVHRCGAFGTAPPTAGTRLNSLVVVHGESGLAAARRASLKQ